MSTEKKLLRIKQNKSDRRIARKICKMIRRDEFRKLNSFIDGDTNSVVHPDSVLNRRGMTGLMISCKLGHPDCLNVFLRHGASKNLTCFKGNIALHYAAKFCMKNPYPSNVRDLVTIPFMDPNHTYFSEELMKIPNKNGTTPKLLLDALHKLMAVEESDDSDSESDETTDTAQATAQNSKNWSQKLQQENEDEHYEHFGKYDNANNWDEEHGVGYKNIFNETEDQWADRIYAEFSRMQRSRNQLRHPTKNKTSSPPPVSRKKELRLKIPKKTPSLDNRLSNLLDRNNTEPITINSLPFDEDSPSEYIVRQLLGSPQDQDRKKIKDIIRIWHPDKFSQMFHHRIHPEQRDNIIRIVTRISQALLNFGRQIN